MAVRRMEDWRHWQVTEHGRPQAGAMGCTCTPWILTYFFCNVVLLQHINSLSDIFKEHRDHAEEYFRDDILSKADKLGIDLILPRICSRQTHPANTAGLDFESYHRTRLYIPYLDSLVSSLTSRFSSNNNAQFNLFYLHPKVMQELEREEFKSNYCQQRTVPYRQLGIRYEEVAKLKRCLQLVLSKQTKAEQHHCVHHSLEVGGFC